MSISPFNCCFGLRIGCGCGGQSSDRQTTSGGGQFAGEPFNGKLQASAGGVTGAVPHMVKKNIGMIANLLIWKVMIVS